MMLLLTMFLEATSIFNSKIALRKSILHVETSQLI